MGDEEAALLEAYQEQLNSFANFVQTQEKIKELEADVDEETGQPRKPLGLKECSYFVRFGECKFGKFCKYSHPNIPVNSSGYALRPGEDICPHYSRQGKCKFGRACKYDHPEVLVDAAQIEAFITRYPIDERALEYLLESSPHVQHRVISQFKVKREGEADYSGLLMNFVKMSRNDAAIMGMPDTQANPELLRELTLLQEVVKLQSVPPAPVMPPPSVLPENEPISNLVTMAAATAMQALFDAKAACDKVKKDAAEASMPMAMAKSAGAPPGEGGSGPVLKLRVGEKAGEMRLKEGAKAALAKLKDLAAQKGKGDGKGRAASRSRSPVREVAPLDPSLPANENEQAIFYWLAGLDHGAGEMLQYFAPIKLEFDCDLRQLACVLRLTASVDVQSLAGLAQFWGLLGMHAMEHKMLFCKALRELPLAE